MTTNIRSIFMNDCNGQRLAEFLITDKGVITITHFPLMHIIESDYSKPISQAKPARRWPLDGFLRYLVDVCAQYKNEPVAPTVETCIDYVYFGPYSLDRTVTAKDLANITGIAVKHVRELLRNHLTFPDQAVS